MFGLTNFPGADGMTVRRNVFAATSPFSGPVNPLPLGAIYELDLCLPHDQHALLVAKQFHVPAVPPGELKQDRPSAFRRGCCLTAGALGVAFLAGQMVDIFSLPFGSPTSSTGQAPFMPLTGFHGCSSSGAMMI